MRCALPRRLRAILLVVVLGALLPGPRPAHADDGDDTPPPVPAQGSPDGAPAEGTPDGVPAASPSATDEPAPEPPQPERTPEDTLIHRNGSVWKGRILQETDEEIVLERVSKSGGVGRITFPRADIRIVRRARPDAARADEAGPRLEREEWFLLRSSGRIVGTRRLEVWSVRSRGEPGFRLEEAIEYFAQGPQLPATRTHRTEEVDERFLPRLLAYREEGDASSAPGGPARYTRSVSGRVVKSLWRGSSFRGGDTHRCEIEVPTGTRGPLGTREYLLRMPRRVGLLDLRVLDPNREEIVHVRAGFTSVTQDPSGRRPGHEFHWEQDERRFISYFDANRNTVQERIGEGLEAMPVSREQAEAAAEQAGTTTRVEAGSEVRLAEAGIAFTPPGPLWVWQGKAGSPGHTGWRLLGRLANAVLVSDVRVEWHPRQPGSEREAEAVEAWLLRRLRAVSPDVEVQGERRELTGLDGAWQLEVQGTLRRESVRTVAVVVDRPDGRVVLLLASPAGAWEQVRPAIARIVRSIRLL